MELSPQMKEYRLTTAEIIYKLPDHPLLLQTYVWQDYDLAPKFPVLHQFLDFWQKKLDGQLHSVRLASVSLITAGECQHRRYEFMLQ